MSECLHPNTWRDSWQCECGELHTRCSSCAAFVDGCSLEGKPVPLRLVASKGPADEVRAAAKKLSDGRTLFAQHFLLAKNGLLGKKNVTDEEARQMATDVTKDELTTLQAEYEIALHRMREG